MRRNCAARSGGQEKMGASSWVVGTEKKQRQGVTSKKKRREVGKFLVRAGSEAPAKN